MVGFEAPPPFCGGVEAVEGELDVGLVDGGVDVGDDGFTEVGVAEVVGALVVAVGAEDVADVGAAEVVGALVLVGAFEVLGLMVVRGA